MPAHEGDYTIKQWCAHHGYSLGTYYTLRKAGHAPETFYLPGFTSARITQAADRDWQQRMVERAKSAEGQREAERRLAQRVAAGHAAVATDNHISKRRSRERLPKLDFAPEPRQSAAEARMEQPRWKPNGG
jgi:hypothetical protein